LITLLNNNFKCYNVSFILLREKKSRKERKIGKKGLHHYLLAFKRKKRFCRELFVAVSINLANGRIAASWKSIDQYAS
jgi:hypothetical protein